MKEALSELTGDQIAFICKECNLTEDELNAMDEDDIYNIVYEAMCEIEIDEVCSSENGEETERCTMASDIVTILGNALAAAEGYFSEDEDA